MGRIPTFVVVIIGVVLIVGLSALMFFVMLKPQQEALGVAQKKLDEETADAAKLETAEANLAAVQVDWLEKHAQLDELMKSRSIPISFAHPATAMVALWYEYREDLVPLIERWVESSGCTIESGASFPAPAMTPPPVPSAGFMQIPSGQPITLTVSGDLESLERLYRSLDQFERIVTVGQLVITSEGGNLRAQVPFKFYLLAEVPESAAAAAPEDSGSGPGPEDGMIEDPGMIMDGQDGEEGPPPA